MNNPKGFILTVIIIALPIIYLIVQLNNINSTYDVSGEEYRRTESEINHIIAEEMNNSDYDLPSGNESNSGEDTHNSSIYGNPISKVIEGAKINVESAFIYREPDDTLTPITSFRKDYEVTVQDYENGWSNIKFNDVTGWIRTEYVTKPSDEGSLVSSAVGHKGIVNVKSMLTVRDAGSSDANQVDAINDGTEVNIIGANEKETWYQIQYGTKSGWVSADYIRVVYN